MKLSLSALVLFFAAVFAAGCGRDRAPLSPGDTAPESAAVDADQVAFHLVSIAHWPADQDAVPSDPTIARQDVANVLEGLDRQALPGGIAHYSFRVRVGSGPYDVIGVHRVVRESAPYVPVRTGDAVFLQHGDVKDFTGMFLPGVTSPGTPDDFGFAVYLAANGVDVWGIDQSWTLVPASETNLAFMADWGLGRNVADLQTGIEVARAVRRITGFGDTQMNLLGFSSGAVTAFALAGVETRTPPPFRNVGGILAADYGIVSDIETIKAAYRDEVNFFNSELAAGRYALESPFPLFGPPARDDPNGASALIPGLTNLQAAIGAGAWPAYAGDPYHFVAGIFDADGIPTGLQYSAVNLWVDFMVSGPPYEPYAFTRDYEQVVANPDQSPWDDRLSSVKVPVLYVETGGEPVTSGWPRWTLSEATTSPCSPPAPIPRARPSSTSATWICSSPATRSRSRGAACSTGSATTGPADRRVDRVRSRRPPEGGRRRPRGPRAGASGGDAEC